MQAEVQAEARANDSDTALFLSARSGDKDAFCSLLEGHRPMLLAVCRRILMDAGLAEDAAQEAVLQAMLGLDQLRRPERFGAWLAGIGLNVCRRWLRDRSRHIWSWEEMQGGWQALQPNDCQSGPEELAQANDLAARVRHAVADLPHGQRAAVMLFYLSGLTYAETAAVLGIEVGAVKTRLHKARKTLRGQLWATWKEEIRMQLDAEVVEVRMADVRRKPAHGDKPGYYMLVLEEIGGERRLPIWVGQFEGTAIALQLQKVEVPRPPTFSFVSSLLQASGGQLREVRVSKLVESTFYAVAVIEGVEGIRTVDARPSDALALALVTGAPIRVEPAVFGASKAHLATHRDRLPRQDTYYAEGTQGAAEIVEEVTSRWRSGAGPSQPG